MRAWIGLMVVPLLLGLTRTTGAEEEAGRGRRGGRDFWRSERMVEMLALTPEQVEQLEAQDENFAARSRELGERARASRKEMKEVLAAEEFSAEKATELGKSIAEQAAERVVLETERQIAIRGILTSEQWSKLEAGRKRMGERMMKRMKGRMRHGHRGQGSGSEEESETSE